MIPTRTVAATLGLSIVAAALTACSVPVPKPSATCAEAFKAASSEMNTLYATHPFYGPEYDALYEDGVITDEEQVELDAMMADEEAKYNALVDPVFDACENVTDLYAGAYAYRNEADWALQESEYVSREEAQNYFVVAYCTGNEARRACSDFDPDDWR